MNAQEEKRKASREVREFMDRLNFRYDADIMRRLEDAEGVMERRWGIIGLADMIRKNKNDAELALLRWAMKHPAQPEPEPELDIPILMPRRFQKRKQHTGRLVLLGAVIVMVLFITGLMVASIDAIDRTERTLAMSEVGE